MEAELTFPAGSLGALAPGPAVLVPALGSGFRAAAAASVFSSTLAWMEIKGGHVSHREDKSPMPRGEEAWGCRSRPGRQAEAGRPRSWERTPVSQGTHSQGQGLGARRWGGVGRRGQPAILPRVGAVTDFLSRCPPTQTLHTPHRSGHGHREPLPKMDGGTENDCAGSPSHSTPHRDPLHSAGLAGARGGEMGRRHHGPQAWWAPRATVA